MRCELGHRSYLRIGQRRKCGSQRCRPRSEISSRRRLRTTAGGSAGGMLACWRVGMRGSSCVPFLLRARVRGRRGRRLVLVVLCGGVADVGERPRSRTDSQQHDRQRIRDQRPPPPPPQAAAFPARPGDAFAFPGMSGEGWCRLLARLTCNGTTRWLYRSEATTVCTGKVPRSGTPIGPAWTRHGHCPNASSTAPALSVASSSARRCACSRSAASRRSRARRAR